MKGDPKLLLYPTDALTVEAHGPGGLVEVLRIVVQPDGHMTVYPRSAGTTNA